MSQQALREAYTHLTASFSKRHKLSHALSLMVWDNAVNLPPGSAPARGAASALLEVMIHDELVHPSNLEKLKVLQDSAVQQTFSEVEQANIREMKRVIDAQAKLPPELVERKSKLTTEAELKWRVARKENDWATMEPVLEQLFDLAREVGECLRVGREAELTTYDALLDQYEPGIRVRDIDAVFTELKEWLPAAIKARLAAQGEFPVLPEAKYPIEKQKALGRELLENFNFDFTRGRIDASTHPMCAGVPEDVRMTTRYYEPDFGQNIMGVAHECGHALYEQNRPRDLLDQPVSLARSMGVHESQSLLNEMHLTRSLPFQRYFLPLLKKHLDVNTDAETLYKRAIYVKRDNKIRVDADEMTYPLHVLLRYEIERGVIERQIAVKDIPKMWNEKMKQYLDIDTAGDYQNGCLQDIHWFFGIIGYFPTYTLGAMYSAQIMAAIRRDLGDEKVDADVEKGQFGDVQAWLKDKIWSKGSLYETSKLLETATGEPFTSKYFKAHLLKRYPSGQQ